VGSVQDVTEQVKAEEMLRESEQHLKNAERLAHMGHWQWDLKVNRVSGSEEMYRIFGKPLDYVPSYNGFLDDLNPPDRERMQELIQDSLVNKIGHSIEYQIGIDGDPRTIFCIWEVLLDEDGEPIRVFGTCQDITDAKRAQEEFTAKQKLESVGTLASGIAHDFNNILGAVQAQSDLALNELDAGSSCREELKAIGEVAMRGSEIVRQLMIYAGTESAAAERADLSKTVADILNLLRVSVSKHALIETDLEQVLPATLASAAQIRQIVMNLVTNASDAVGDQDGVIRITTRHVILTGNSRAISFRTLPAGNYAQLEVADTGRGMSPETQANVFDPFFTTKSPGRGLGLAVVQGIARSLGGAIHFTSELGKGSTFQVLLPCVETTAAESSCPPPVVRNLARPSLNSAILFVEDEDNLRKPVAKMLRTSGFEVFEAADGTSAINLLRDHGAGIDAIVLDMTLPGASSREIVAEAANAKPDIRVILTSAHSRELIEGTINAPQVRSFIRKPFPFSDLLKELRSTLSS
jgi:PAS domain S-box-containing protein